ncbi:hypothetical protein A1F99_133810 [Pyrenophora tritici-repentis]|nr:hypothetical protein A1F99_133810 [Pyrenophora tritici-repentis]
MSSGGASSTCSYWELATDINDQRPLTNYWCDDKTETGGVIYMTTPEDDMLMNSHTKPAPQQQVQQIPPPQQQHTHYDPNAPQAPQFYDPNAHTSYAATPQQGGYAVPPPEKTPAATSPVQMNPYYADNGPVSPVPQYSPAASPPPVPANVNELPTGRM